MAEHKWLEGLGLEKTGDGKWRHTSALQVDVDEDEYHFTARLLGRRIEVCAYKDIQTRKMSEASVQWSSIGEVPATGARTFAAALQLAADIADAYNAQREG